MLCKHKVDPSHLSDYQPIDLRQDMMYVEHPVRQWTTNFEIKRDSIRSYGTIILVTAPFCYKEEEIIDHILKIMILLLIYGTLSEITVQTH